MRVIASGISTDRRDTVYLSDEVCRLLAYFDGVKNVSIERIEVRGGIPQRVILRTPAGVHGHLPSTFRCATRRCDPDSGLGSGHSPESRFFVHKDVYKKFTEVAVESGAV